MDTPQIKTREDLAKLLASIGPPGKKQDEKLKAVQELGMKNKQGHPIELILEGFKEY